MKVFVTGGSGIIGGHLVEGLVRAGHEVSALARSPKSADVVRRYGAAPVAADPLSPFARASSGVERSSPTGGGVLWPKVASFEPPSRQKTPRKS
ncbi:NAD-dependent epimerase/dehydratase family protein [Sorangium sp. So ce145]|uniref:NAD-dependent epimerase/dehydratase family protein n=1 Tax=Sorangium sp. So ce145 TaxID=3133285 RepID=UPI003F6031D4